MGSVEAKSVSFQEKREQEANQFGAFIQVFEKRKGLDGDFHVSCISYPLPGGISDDQAKRMLFDIRGNNPYNISYINNYYRSESGELQFLAQEGMQFNSAMLNRFLDVPQKALGVDQTIRRRELIEKGVIKEFNSGLSGQRYESAQASIGENIFAFSYRVGEDGLYGKDRQGNEGKKLSELALEGDIEHKEMLEKLEKRLIEMDEGVIINFDKSKTVSKCCALFFKDKLKGVVDSVKNSFSDLLSFLGGPKFAAVKLGESNLFCDKCEAVFGECPHTKVS